MNQTDNTKDNRKPLGIYIHMPFCVRKCRYCDFVSYPLSSCTARDPDVLEHYCDELCTEIVSCSKGLYEATDGAFVVDGNNYYVDSVFFGGGTPTLAKSQQIGRVLDALRSVFSFAQDPEITTEANPESATFEKLTSLRALGFNRLSLGVQSLQDKELRAMGRIHGADAARRAFEDARRAGFDNVSCDLIFGAPLQTTASWQRSFDELLSWRPEHLSFYSLQLEEGTPFYADYRCGVLQLPSWEEDRAMYWAAVHAVLAAGYRHYEVSNAALPGRECRHNLKYWNMEDYLGFGTAAHSFAGLRASDGSFAAGVRFFDGSGISGFAAERTVEQEDLSALKGDYIFTRLRLTDGFPLSEYASCFGASFRSDFPSAAELSAQGSLILDDGYCRLTDSGLDATNNVMERLLTDIQADA